jgi:N-acetyl-anhydromuramyl-L-alanine amidase AmpD
MNITQLRNSNAFPGRYGWKPKWLILHGTAGGTSAQAIAQYFKNTEGTDNPTSSTYVIGVPGEIFQCNSESDGAYCNGVVTAGHDPWWSETNNPNPNNVTINIEHCKAHTDNSDQLTEAQKQSSFQLVKDICQRNGIPMRPADANGGITGHYSIDPVNRARCPGAYPWSELWAYLAGQPQEEEQVEITLSTPGVSQFFEGTATSWKCKQTGYTIDFGGLIFYRTFGNRGLCGLDHMGLPTSAAIGIPGKPGVVFQRFERVVLVYDPKRIYDNPPGSVGDFYLAHIDQGITQDPRVPALTVQNAQLKDQVAVLQKQLDEKQVIPQAVKEDILILGGNIDKLKQDAGLTI